MLHLLLLWSVMARTEHTAKHEDEGEGSDQSCIPAKDKGKGVADQPRKTKKLCKKARVASAAGEARSGTLRIMLPADQDIESPPRTRFASSQRSCSASTTQSGMKRPRAETASVPLVSIDATARRVKKLRFVSVEEWFREPQDDRAGRDFYTLLQEAFFRAYEARGFS